MNQAPNLFSRLVLTTLGSSFGVMGVSAEVLEEVIVTAQKRDESAQDVGIAITVISGEQMRGFGMYRSNDVGAQTPGLNTDGPQGGTSVSLPTIRGVAQNDFSFIQEAPAAVYQDGAYMSSVSMGSFGIFDMERVEVLRGPQGTLFGRNATGGVIHYISRAPTDEFEGYGDVQLDEQNGFGFRTQYAVSGPVGENVRARLAGYYEGRDGYWDNNLAGANDTYEIDGDYAIRFRANFDPTERLTVGVNVLRSDFGRSENGTYTYRPGAPDPVTGFGADITPESDPGAVNFVCPGCDFFGQTGSESNPNDSSFNDVGYVEKELWSVTGNVVWQHENFTVTSITNYQHFFSDYNEDCDGSPVDYCQFPIRVDPLEQISEEIRFDGVMDRLTWQVGFYYLDIDATTSSGFQSTVFDFATGDQLTQETESWAVFTHLQYQLTDRWGVTGGLRWTEDKKKIESVPAFTDGSSNDPAIINLPANAIDSFKDRQSGGEWAGKFSVDFTPTDEWLFYAGVTRGHKAGGYVVNVNGVPLGDDDREFDPEVLVSYEGGFKASNLFGQPLHLNGAGFYYDYDDYQSFDYQGLASFIRNRDAEIYGAELELVASPGEGWDLLLGAAYLDTEVKGIVTPSGLTVNREAPKAPDFTANGSLRKAWPALGGTLAAQMDYHYSAKSYASVANSQATKLPSYVVGNARLAYTSHDSTWDVAVFVRNFTDTDVPIFAYDQSQAGNLGINVKAWAPPRVFGMQARYTWN